MKEGDLLVPEELIGKAIRAIKYLLEQNYFKEKTESGFIADAGGFFAAEFAIDFLTRIGHAEWIRKPRIAKVYWQLPRR